MYLVQTSYKNGKYKTKYSVETKSVAVTYYNGINIGNKHNKRLLESKAGRTRMLLRHRTDPIHNFYECPEGINNDKEILKASWKRKASFSYKNQKGEIKYYTVEVYDISTKGAYGFYGHDLNPDVDHIKLFHFHNIQGRVKLGKKFVPRYQGGYFQGSTY